MASKSGDEATDDTSLSLLRPDPAACSKHNSSLTICSDLFGSFNSGVACGDCKGFGVQLAHRKFIQRN